MANVQRRVGEATDGSPVKQTWVDQGDGTYAPATSVGAFNAATDSILTSSFVNALNAAINVGLGATLVAKNSYTVGAGKSALLKAVTVAPTSGTTITAAASIAVFLTRGGTSYNLGTGTVNSATPYARTFDVALQAADIVSVILTAISADGAVRNADFTISLELKPNA